MPFSPQEEVSALAEPILENITGGGGIYSTLISPPSTPTSFGNRETETSQPDLGRVGTVLSTGAGTVTPSQQNAIKTFDSEIQAELPLLKK